MLERLGLATRTAVDGHDALALLKTRGDEVDVVVLKFDRDKERVSLGYKQRFEDPWVLVPEKYPIGKKVSGKVVS